MGFLSRWERTIVDDAGNRIDRPNVRVQHELIGAPLALIKGDIDGATPLSNPFTAEPGVDPFFYVAGGLYKITVTKGAITRVYRHVPLGSAAASDSPPLVFLGAWNSSDTYDINHVVLHDGSSYSAIIPSTNIEPGADPVWADYWQLLAMKGNDGSSVEGPGMVFAEQASAPATPAAGYVTLYAKTDHEWYGKDNTGVERPIAGVTRAMYDELVLTTSLLALQLADNTNAALFGGDAGNRVFDSFDALTYVDTGAATNLDTGTAGVLKPTTSTTTTTLNTSALTAAGQNLTLIDRTATVPTSRVITKIGVYCAAARTFVVKVVKRNSANNYDVLVSQSFAHPGGGWADCTLSSAYTVPGSGTFYLAASTPAGGSNPDITGTISRATSSGDLTGTGVTATEDAAGGVFPLRYTHTPTTNNLTVRSTGLTAAAPPTKMRGIIRVKEVDAATAGTDYTLEFSRDGATTWTAATLTSLFVSPSPTASIRVLQTNEVSLSAQPSGTAMRWRFKTLTGKMVELHDVGVYWH